MMWHTFPILIALGAPMASAEPASGGWRGDGTGRAPTITAPDGPWTPRWTTPLPEWSNASPVRLGDRLCAHAEPTSVLCVDAETGALDWSAAHPVVEALEPSARAKAREQLQELEALEAEEQTLKASVGPLRRRARSADAADAREALATVETRLLEVQSRIAELIWLRAPVDRSVMGYTTATPVTDGQKIWSLFANGVVSCHRADGTLVWQRWLGEPIGQMRGYNTGHAASPVLVGGTLVVPWRHLQGLDPDTGAVRWTDEAAWRDFGAPAATVVQGEPLVFTPTGRMLSARDGRELQAGLGNLYYVGPYAVGDRVFYVGGQSGEHTSGQPWDDFSAWRITVEGGTPKATELWTTRVHTREVFYTSPVLFDAHLYSVDKTGLLRVIDAANGEVVHQQDLYPELRGWTYPSPWVVGDRVWIGSGRGRFVAMQGGAVPRIVARVDLAEDMRATPWFEEGAVFVRSLGSLVRYGAPDADGSAP